MILYKMNEIVNKFLLAGDKFKPEVHLKHPQVIYSACGPFTKGKEIIQKLENTGDSNIYIYIHIYIYIYIFEQGISGMDQLSEKIK